MRLVARHAEHSREVGTLQIVPEVEFDDLALTRAQLVQGVADEPGQFGPLGASPDVSGSVGGRIGQAGVLTEAYLRRTQLAVAFIAGDCEQPGSQLARIAQAIEPACGDDEGVFHRVGGILRLSQHPAAVTV